MKPKKYSEFKIKATNKFLSKYNLTFDNLNELQQKATVSYTYHRKFLFFGLVVLLLAIIIFSYWAFVSYLSVGYFVGESSDPSTLTPQLRGKACFGLGLCAGATALTAFYLFLNALIFPWVLRQKRQIFDAFLPSLNQSSNNE